MNLGSELGDAQAGDERAGSAAYYLEMGVTSLMIRSTFFAEGHDWPRIIGKAVTPTGNNTFYNSSQRYERSVLRADMNRARAPAVANTVRN